MGIVQCLPLYYFTEHPIMLQNTAGEKGEYPQNSERVKSCSKRHFHPFLSVYLIKSKQGRKRNTSQPLPWPCPVVLWGTARKEVLIKQESAPPKSPVCGYRQEFHCQPHGFSTEPEISTDSFLLSIYKYYLCHNRNWKTFDSYIDSN